MKSNDLFTNEVVTMRPAGTLADATRLMEKHNVGTVVVAEGDRPVGMVSDRDIALALGKNEATPVDHVQKIMCCPVTTIGIHEGIFKATRLMREKGLRRLVVMDDAGRLAGLVSLDDLFFHLGRELNNLANAIRPEIRCAC